MNTKNIGSLEKNKTKHQKYFNVVFYEASNQIAVWN